MTNTYTFVTNYWISETEQPRHRTVKAGKIRQGTEKTIARTGQLDQDG
jgi:hypothetical protein